MTTDVKSSITNNFVLVKVNTFSSKMSNGRWWIHHTLFQRCNLILFFLYFSVEKVSEEVDPIATAPMALIEYSVRHAGVNSKVLLPLWSTIQDGSLDNCLWTELCSASLASFRQSPGLIIPDTWRKYLMSGRNQSLQPQMNLPRVSKAKMDILHEIVYNKRIQQ